MTHLTVPPADRNKAQESSQDFRRLFHTNYNGVICNMTFSINLKNRNTEFMQNYGTLTKMKQSFYSTWTELSWYETNQEMKVAEMDIYLASW